MKGRSGQQGFTFIELMIVVAIIGILAAIVMPNIKNYSARAKVSEAVFALSGCRTPVSEIYLAGGDTLPDQDAWGCEGLNKSKYVDSVSVSGNSDPLGAGIIKVMIGNVGDLRVSTKYITMAPLNRSGQVMNADDLGNGVFRWRCGATADGTDLELEFLPATCRG
jgi:type IV pilus assembly protein PilA